MLLNIRLISGHTNAFRGFFLKKVYRLCGYISTLHPLQWSDNLAVSLNRVERERDRQTAFIRLSALIRRTSESKQRTPDLQQTWELSLDVQSVCSLLEQVYRIVAASLKQSAYPGCSQIQHNDGQIILTAIKYSACEM
jgi:hypothetical protein